MDDTFDNDGFDREGRRKAAHNGAGAPRSDLMRETMRGYVAMPRDVELAAAIADLVDAAELSKEEIERGEGVGRLREGRMIVLVGSSGTGKTTALHRAFSKHPRLAGYSLRDGRSPLASFAVSSPATLKQLGNDGLRALRYETMRDMKENIVWQVLRTQLRHCGIRFLHIDELQHVFQNPNRVEQQKVRDTLKALMQQPDWPTWLIASGLPSIATFFQADDQLRRRCTFVRFDDLDFARDAKPVGQIVTSLCARAGLGHEGLVKSADDPVSTDEFVHRLIHASLARVGIAIEFVQDACLEALSANAPTLGVEHFGAVYRARSGCLPDANVFSVADWSAIDVRAALYPPDEDPAKERKRRRGTGIPRQQ